MQDAERKRLLDRLSRVEGQVRGVRKMLEDGRECEEVLTQLAAARSGLEGATGLMLERHLLDCVLGEMNLSSAAWEELRETLRLVGRT